MAGSFDAPLSHNTRRRKTPPENNCISYYEVDTDSEDGYGSDTIVVDVGPWKKRRAIVIDDGSDDEIHLAKLSAVRQDGGAGKLFRGLPIEA
jgi:hypothetical protein